MKNFTLATRLTLLLLLLAVCPSLPAGAQDAGSVPTFLSKVESFTTSDNNNVTFQYIEVPNQGSLEDLARRMTDNSNYPLVVLKKDIFGPGIEIVKTLDLQILNYELRDRQWQVLDSINVEKFQRMEEIARLQEARVAVYDSANVQLREQIVQLNDQLDASVELTRKTIRARQVKNLWIGALGGVFGFSVGVLISALN